MVIDWYTYIKGFYENGLWTKRQVFNVVGIRITPEQYKEITGDEYDPNNPPPENEEPTTEDPATEEPATEEPTTDPENPPSTEEPTTEEPVTEDPPAEEPTTDGNTTS